MAFTAILYMAVMLTVFFIVINSNTPSKALAYLMLITIIPVGGIIIYFSIGVNYRKRKLYKKKLTLNRDKYPKIEERHKAYAKKLFEEHADQIGHFYKLAYNDITEYQINSSSGITLLLNGEQKFPRLLDDLKSAQKYIHIEYYIFENDEIGQEILNILIEKAKGGVQVRFMYDDFGSSSLRKSFVNQLNKAGGEALPFYKIKWLLFANGINYRNHRKIVVIDGTIGYVGGINVSDKYINNGKKELYWRDTSMRIVGRGVLGLQYTFLVDWNFCAQQNLEFSEELFPMEASEKESVEEIVQIIASGPDSDYPGIMYAMVQAVQLSKYEVLITTPYFIPDESFLDALKIAKLSGVNVKLLIPGISDSKLVNAISSSYYQDLLDTGIEIYRYQKGFVHAKTMVCDGQVSFVGTANLDARSFDLNFEVHGIVYSKPFAEELRNAFYKDLEDAEAINANEWRRRPFINIFAERLARLISPLM